MLAGMSTGKNPSVKDTIYFQANNFPCDRLLDCLNICRRPISFPGSYQLHRGVKFSGALPAVAHFA